MQFEFSGMTGYFTNGQINNLEAMQYAFGMQTKLSWFKQQIIISKSDLLGQCKHIVHNEEALAMLMLLGLKIVHLPIRKIASGNTKLSELIENEKMCSTNLCLNFFSKVNVSLFFKYIYSLIR